MDIRILTPGEIRALTTALIEGQESGRDVHVSWQNGLQVKIGGGMWSAPMGR